MKNIAILATIAGCVACTPQQVTDATACLAGVQAAMTANPGQTLPVIVASVAACSAFIVDVTNGVITVTPKVAPAAVGRAPGR